MCVAHEGLVRQADGDWRCRFDDICAWGVVELHVLAGRSGV